MRRTRIKLRLLALASLSPVDLRMRKGEVTQEYREVVKR
jgi:hypothetical protein